MTLPQWVLDIASDLKLGDLTSYGTFIGVWVLIYLLWPWIKIQRERIKYFQDDYEVIKKRRQDDKEHYEGVIQEQEAALNEKDIALKSQEEEFDQLKASYDFVAPTFKLFAQKVEVLVKDFNSKMKLQDQLLKVKDDRIRELDTESKNLLNASATMTLSATGELTTGPIANRLKERKKLRS